VRLDLLVENGEMVPEPTPSLEDPGTAQMASDPADKAEVFRKAIFPSPPEAEIGDLEDATYPDRICDAVYY
jgi:hypothetical protein